MPMGLNSTPFISYHQINTENTDLISDAYGFDTEFTDVVNLLDEYEPLPEDELISSLIGLVQQVR
jgi:hypothetical protein